MLNLIIRKLLKYGSKYFIYLIVDNTYMITANSDGYKSSIYGGVRSSTNGGCYGGGRGRPGRQV